MSWQTAHLSPTYDVLAPDGSEIRLLVQVAGASMVHCTLPAGQVSRAVRHRTVEEVWFCMAGEGQLWRRSAEAESTQALRPGVAVSIPLGTEFQFRAGERAVEIVIATAPPWPGDDEAVPVEGCWQPSR
jgi:mannose-6-phosphate isomerase-like protein (cupin superfamily)